jgi:hypothetical protein
MLFEVIREEGRGKRAGGRGEIFFFLLSSFFFLLNSWMTVVKLLKNLCPVERIFVNAVV